MGEMHDDLCNGTVCSECGCFFVDSNGKIVTHGFPAVCCDCVRVMKSKKEMSQKGVERYYEKMGIVVSEFGTL